eukprot:NODE_440_length_892_cov_206.466192_g384_i0.p3 GENE.NODE_440_length_892_cov_206.466192_g384_i0~~NODE_440_length_892_cov_206.466192_g384_i0.p3  ORF type:complete len:93 (+),score=28.08 NODE_440_length_892_cov_206.466192_g384_i0:280-558(+)
MAAPFQAEMAKKSLADKLPPLPPPSSGSLPDDSDLKDKEVVMQGADSEWHLDLEGTESEEDNWADDCVDEWHQFASKAVAGPRVPSRSLPGL